MVQMGPIIATLIKAAVGAASDIIKVEVNAHTRDILGSDRVAVLRASQLCNPLTITKLSFVFEKIGVAEINELASSRSSTKIKTSAPAS